jgi:hypothetical protein
MKNKGFTGFFILSIAAICSLSAIFGCKKPSDQIGSDIGVVDGDINSSFTDTLTVNAFTVREDSVRADRTSLVPFGSYFDPYFGVTTSSVYLNFILGNIFSNGLTGVNQVDSVVLRVRFATPTHYGNIGKYKGTIKVSVHQLMEKLTVYSSSNPGYGSTRNLNVNSTPIGTGIIVPNPYDSVSVQGVKEAPHIRIKLNTAFGTQLLSNPGGFTSTQAFADYFYGLFLKVVPANNFGDGGFVYLFPPGEGTRLSVYYNDTSKIEFKVNADNSVWIGHHEHNYSNAIPPFTNLSGPVSGGGSNPLLIQPLTGTKIKIHIPYLKNFNADKSIGINKAELIFPVDPTYLDNYAPTEQLLLSRQSPINDSTYALADDPQSLGTNGGKYDADKKEYKFNIKLHVQAIMSGFVGNDTLVLRAAGQTVRANRVALYGTGNAINKVKLRLYYTKLQ